MPAHNHDLSELEFKPGVADLSKGDFHAEIVRDLLNRAVTLTDVKAAWSHTHDRYQAVSDSYRLGVAASALGAVARLGIDIASDDDRVVPLQRGIELIESGEGEMVYGPTPKNETGIVFNGSFDRLLAACDPRSDTRLQLMPQNHIVSHRVRNLAQDALAFTEDSAFTQPHSYPRKAYRELNDPDSPLHGLAVSTDDYTMLDGGPNLAVFLPTARLYAEEVRAIDNVAESSQYAWRDVFAQGGHLPHSIAAQGLRIGSHDYRPAYDTPQHDIEHFLA